MRASNVVYDRANSSIATATADKFDFDKKKIMLDQPIKAVGEYDVDLWVHPKVKGTIHVSVVAE